MYLSEIFLDFILLYNTHIVKTIYMWKSESGNIKGVTQ
jgi:hypothetical protein